LSQDERAPSAARISVVDASGARVETIVVKDDEREETVRIGDTEAILRLGSVVIDLPYSIHLDDFLLLNYPGSRNPASYESHVRLYDADRGIDGRPVRIYMNHPLSHRGYKHFQSSYDPDELGTVLSVNYDPGKVPTYLGYTLLALGFLMILARDLIWPVRKDERERSAA
ncbi:cytochrome c biogenesis protein ResB, partial [bacterium]|nr:cytochrome c biogenesis protein ResB [bacterium]